MNIGEPVTPALSDVPVRDAAGGEHRLGELWASRDAVVAFVRHFACAGCAEHVAALRPRLGELARSHAPRRRSSIAPRRAWYVRR